MIKMFVLIVGLVLIGFIAWWFFGKHAVATETADVTNDVQEIDVDVNGGYSPEKVVLKKGVPAVLNFTRRDPSTCLDRVVFPILVSTASYQRGEKQAIDIDTSKPGEFQWACGMDMFHGKLIIK